MARSDKQVVQILLKLYDEEFGGKTGARFLIPWADLRGMYGFEKLFYSRFDQLKEAASKKWLYLWDLGEGEHGHQIAVIKASTVDRWRRVPRQVAKTYQLSTNDTGEASEEEDE